MPQDALCALKARLLQRLQSSSGALRYSMRPKQWRLDAFQSALKRFEAFIKSGEPALSHVRIFNMYLFFLRVVIFKNNLYTY
ncbi:MAG: hypothetical protein EOP49_27445 [Sphingobacteriales bacterium]|nr:MAG: hypothetical protein EOP49_27445 [Sphingobacteriales bacterium]